MKLYVSYNGCWRGGLLKGDISKACFNKNRKVLRKRSKDNPVPVPLSTPVSNNTVLGIVYRLVGEQRQMWRVLDSGEYLGIKDKISFKDNVEYVSKEAVALREIGNAKNPCGWTGISKPETNVFYTDKNIYSILCYPLVCDPVELYDLIVNKKFGKANIEMCGRMDVLSVIQNINKENINSLSTQQRKDIISVLAKRFPKVTYKSGDEDKYIIFCLSAMYICAEYLKSIGYKETGVKWNKGISHKTPTPKEFFAAVSSGINTVINFPMDDNWRNKTEKLQKYTGHLEIEIDITAARAHEIKNIIEAANVGCISVGKKGVAYLNGIRI